MLFEVCLLCLKYRNWKDIIIRLNIFDFFYRIVKFEKLVEVKDLFVF